MPKGSSGNNKYREMTKEEQEVAFFKRERDQIWRDWNQAEKVIDAARAVVAAPNPNIISSLAKQLAAYDKYITDEKVKATEPSGLPEKGLVSV